MSVGDEPTECPLCMEQLEMDDINFFPCTCGYQICRFCWHRIRTDENGLCPACRKQYPEDPAEFKPLTEDELQRIKKERRQKDLQRKQKAAENRKHLANVRVVQKNLVFVVGLSQRLADPEVLKKHEYFGKFGKIHKVVINQSTSYAGAQGPSASAYVTYHRPEDALRAIQAVNNVFVDGRTLKASLGTTKYCSHFLKGAQCPKPDCMYLHELGEEAASFTKEEMQQGKHQEYEQKLYEQFMNSVNLTNHQTATTTTTSRPPTSGTVTNSSSSNSSRKKTSSPTLTQQQNCQQSQPSPPLPQSQPSPPLPSSLPPLSHSPPLTHPPPNTNKEAWPSLNSSGGSNGKPERLTNGNKSAPHGSPTSTHKTDTQNGQSRAPGNNRNRHIQQPDIGTHNGKTEGGQTELSGSPVNAATHNSLLSPIGTSRKSPFDSGADSMSLFSSNGFPSSRNKPVIQPQNTEDPPVPHSEIPDTIPVSHSVDWQAAFGFPSNTSAETLSNDDDLGFDPWDESSKALADLIEKETNINSYFNPHNMPDQSKPRNLPPGFTSNHIGAYTVNPGRTDIRGSKMMGLMSFSGLPQNSQLQNTFHDVLSDISLHKDAGAASNPQDGLRALLPNINISFGAPPQSQYHNPHPAAASAGAAGPSPSSQQQQQPQHQHPQQQQHQMQQQQQQQHPFMPPQKLAQTQDSDWLAYDPAIVTSGNITDSSSLSDDPPHWMKSLQQLTEVDSAPTHNNHRLPFVHSFPFRAPPSWPQQNTQLPPPGFQNAQMRSHTQLTDSQQLGGLQ